MLGSFLKLLLMQQGTCGLIVSAIQMSHLLALVAAMSTGRKKPVVEQPVAFFMCLCSRLDVPVLAIVFQTETLSRTRLSVDGHLVRLSRRKGERRDREMVRETEVRGA